MKGIIVLVYILFSNEDVFTFVHSRKATTLHYMNLYGKCESNKSIRLYFVSRTFSSCTSKGEGAVLIVLGHVHTGIQGRCEDGEQVS